MDKAVDYNALSWVRQEIELAIRKAQEQLHGYATDPEKTTLLSDCVALLHQIRGPLKIAGLASTELLVSEMESATGALMDSVDGSQAALLESLQQVMALTGDYLARLQSGADDCIEEVMPLIKSLRGTTGGKIPADIMLDLIPTATLPEGVFQGGEQNDPVENEKVVHAARVRFQSSLLAWYRSGLDNKTIQQLRDVLDVLRQNAGGEPEARLWWVAAGLADALEAGLLGESNPLKQLFGKLDRQIKRRLDDAGMDFNDEPSVSLVRSMLQCIAEIPASECSDRIQSVITAFGLDQDASGVCCLETQETGGSGQCNTVMPAGFWESAPGEDQHTGGMPVRSDGPAMRQSGSDPDSGDKHRQKQIIQGVLRGIFSCKEAIEDYLVRGGDAASLCDVPNVLVKVCSELNSVNQLRAARVLERVQEYINREMHEGSAVPGDDRLDRLADTICAVEFFLEGLRDGRIFGDGIVELAERSLSDLGYPVLADGDPDASAHIENDAAVADSLEQVLSTESVTTGVSGLQVIDPQADSEILDIFLEESESELRTLRDLVTGLDEASNCGERLEEIARCLHTIKGNGRMLGAFVIGEFACSMEKLVQAGCAGDIAIDRAFGEFMMKAVDGLSQLVEQVRDHESTPVADVDGLLSQMAQVGAAGKIDTAESGEAGSNPDQPCNSETEPAGYANGLDLEILAADADPEIVEIFIEEAEEALASLAGVIPAWSVEPGVDDVLADIRRVMHTMKGSGRMAGAVLTGEYAWSMENLLNRVIEGSVGLNGEVIELVIRSPEMIRMLVDQIRTGSGDAEVINGIIVDADRLVQGGVAAVNEEAAEPAGDMESQKPGDLECEDPSMRDGSGSDSDPALLQIYVKETRDILGTLETALNDDPASQEISEPVYRALHTLSGISESAGVPTIGKLALELDRYFSALYRTQREAPKEALELLRDSIGVISDELEQVSGTSSASGRVEQLCMRLESLPDVTGDGADEQPAVSADIENALEPEEGVAPVLTGSEQVFPQEGGAPEMLAVVDEELFDVFMEEAAEILDASERLLNTWAEEPENTGAVVEYQRNLHTLKGSARMMNITAIGDLSHSLETLLARVAEGAVSASANLFSTLFVAQDKLTEMIEMVRQRSMPDISIDLQEVLQQLSKHNDDTALSDSAADPGVAANPEDVQALFDPGLELGTQEMPVDEISGEAGSWPQQDAQTVNDEVHESEIAATVEGIVHAEEADRMNLSPSEVTPDAGQAQNISAIEYPAVPLRVPEERPSAESQKTAKRRSELVKVQSELLDDLVNYAGEINIYRTRMETQIGDYRFNLGELEQTIGRLREQLRKLEIETETQILYRFERDAGESNQEFDPLELDRYSNLQESSRSLMESISDLYSLTALMENTTRDSETLLLQQSRVSTDLQEGLMRTRMIPFAGLETRLRRIVRQSARQLGKSVDLVLHGADGEMDRAVIERITAPLEHMLRNAVAHGIESPEERRLHGKEEAGTIWITFGREGPDIVLCIEDDGAGMNVAAIREKAVEKGLLEPGSDITENDVIQFVLQTGFSTASEITQISGRGVGLDVVNSEVKQLGGALHIESNRGKGTRFTIRLPYTLAINQALLVSAGTETYCIPLGNVEGVVRESPENLMACYTASEPMYEYAGNQYQLKHLATLLNTAVLNPVQMSARVPVLLMRFGDRRIALHVEALFGSREIVIKPLGVQLSSIDGLSGATILGDGSVVMILDVFSLMRSSARTQFPSMWSASQNEKRLFVMVVDDSITVRKVTSRLLERNGYKVVTARDGVDAIGKLHGTVPDIMLLDIEMPRMDGFELATHMKNDERLRHVPIVMITSRTGDKHRERARHIGVNNYLGKPYQENDLLDTIDRIIRVVPDDVEVRRA